MPNGLTQLQVYNRALDALGARAQLTSTTQVSPECDVLNDNFTSAINMLLQKHDWSFARLYTSLTAAPTGDVIPGWAGVYTVPSACLTFLGIWNGRVWGSQPNVPFEVCYNGVSGDIVGTNFPSPVGVYTAALSDPTQCSPLFCEALVYALASLCAFDITESAQLAPAMEQVAMNQLQNAIERDGVQRRTVVGVRYDPDWLAVRR